jgi:1,2-diacylglycerol 3-alpha-glucosyltransferase
MTSIGSLHRPACRLLPTSVPGALFVIAGEGPARESLRALVGELQITEEVRFIGYLERDSELLDCYAAADVFVFASRTETQGLVLLEAMAQGAPVVSTAKLGTRSIVKAGCGAILVAEELNEFAAAAVRVLQDRQLRRTLAEEGRRYARDWSSLSMARRLAELYQRTRRLAGARAAARFNSALSGGI